MASGGFVFRWGPAVRGVLAVAVLAAAFTCLMPSAARADRYSEAGGCSALAPATAGAAAPGGVRLRFQATDRGSSLLYTTPSQFLAAGGGGVVAPAAQPSPAADWVVEDAPGGGFTLSPKSAPDQLLAMTGGGLALVPRASGGGAARLFFPPPPRRARPPAGRLNAPGTAAPGGGPPRPGPG